jgi:hypothetical protein
MKSPSPQSFTFSIENPGEPAAGLLALNDSLTITVDSGNPGGTSGEFEEYMRDCLAEWYDGAKVALVRNGRKRKTGK